MHKYRGFWWYLISSLAFVILQSIRREAPKIGGREGTPVVSVRYDGPGQRRYSRPTPTRLRWKMLEIRTVSPVRGDSIISPFPTYMPT